MNREQLMKKKRHVLSPLFPLKITPFPYPSAMQLGMGIDNDYELE